MMDPKRLFSKVIEAQDKHMTYLDSTQKNLSYYLFGQNIDLVKKMKVSTIPMVDILNVINNYQPKSDNPLYHIVSAFTDELAASDFTTSVKPIPLEGVEPYESYSDMLESMLLRFHTKSKRRSYLKPLAFELLSHGYFGVYFDGKQCHYLTAYNVFPGDKSILDSERQPFWVRKTQVNKAMLRANGIESNNEPGSKDFADSYSDIDDLEMFTAYDVYVKDYDLNIAFTGSGKVIYTQPFPRPKRYPIFIANTSELIDSFYSIPVMTTLINKLKDYQDASGSIKDSSASIAKPILTYDAESGIDVNKLQEALKAGYKHIIVGKNREGDIAFKAPGQLPAYAQDLPERIEDDIMKGLGLNRAFMGLPSGARERGALSRLIKTSFRKLVTISGLIEDVFTELDKYIIDYAGEHCITMQRDHGINIDEIFSGNIEYQPTERFTAYSTEDSSDNKNFVMNQWKSRMIPTATALEALGDKQPRKTIAKLKTEMLDNQALQAKLQAPPVVEPERSIYDIVSSRLNGKLQYRYTMSDLGEGKILLSVAYADLKLAAFMLADKAREVLIDIIAPEAQGLDQAMPGIVNTPSSLMDPTATSMPDESMSPDALSEALKKGEAPSPKTSTVETKESYVDIANPKDNLEELPMEKNVGGFNEAELEQLMAKTSTLISHDKYKTLPGMYIAEPHAKWVFQGRKLVLVLGKKYDDMMNKPLLFCGKLCYGVMILRKIVPDFDFEATKKYHLVSDRERTKWWKDAPVYLYMFEFYPFKFPVDYVRKPGILTFFGQVDFKQDHTKTNEDNVPRLTRYAKEGVGAEGSEQPEATPEKRTAQRG